MRALQGMTVLITGASAGIGRSLAELLAAEGARLALVARRGDRLNELAHALPGSHLTLPADVSQLEHCRHVVEATFAAFGRLDTLVCNAGYGIYKPVHETTPQEMRDLFATNVLGSSDLVAHAVPRMLGQTPRDGWRGQALLVSSCVARRAVPLLGAYSATKAAQLSLAEAMRVELADRRVAVTSVHPIMTRTDFGAAAESHSPLRLPKADRDRFTQDVRTVTEKIVRVIRRPRAELWPHAASRWLFGLGTLMPRFMDRGMADWLRRVLDANRR